MYDISQSARSKIKFPTSGFRSKSDYFYSAFLHKFPLYDKDILQIHRVNGFISRGKIFSGLFAMQFF